MTTFLSFRGEDQGDCMGLMPFPAKNYKQCSCPHKTLPERFQSEMKRTLNVAKGIRYQNKQPHRIAE